MNGLRPHPIQDVEPEITDADFEIISPTGKSGGPFAEPERENRVGYAVLLVSLVVIAFLASGGWNLFRI